MPPIVGVLAFSRVRAFRASLSNSGMSPSFRRVNVRITAGPNHQTRKNAKRIAQAARNSTLWYAYACPLNR